MLDRLRHIPGRIVGLRRAPGGFTFDDALTFGGIGLVAGGAALVYLPAGLIVAGLCLLVLAVGGQRAR